MKGIPLLLQKFKSAVRDNQLVLACNYAGCGSADSWPKVIA